MEIGLVISYTHAKYYYYHNHTVDMVSIFYYNYSYICIAQDLVLLFRGPGVLVLVNDCDWELSGLLDTKLEEKDVVVFISILHVG